MVLAAVEQNEPPDRRLVDDVADLLTRTIAMAGRCSPVGGVASLLVAPRVVRPRVMGNLACRKLHRNKLDEALGDIDAVVILGADWTPRAYRLTATSADAGIRVDLPVNIARR